MATTLTNTRGTVPANGDPGWGDTFRDSTFKQLDEGCIGSKHRRVSDDAWVTPTTGVEYYSPEGFGTRPGKTVYRQYFTQSSWTTGAYGVIATTSGATDLRPVNYRVTFLLTGEYYIVDSSQNAGNEIIIRNSDTNPTTELQLYTGVNYGTAFDGWVDYTKD